MNESTATDQPAKKAPAAKAAPEFIALAERLDVPTRARGLQTVVSNYLIGHDMHRALKTGSFPPTMAAPLLADEFVKGLHADRIVHLRGISKALDHDALRGMCVTNPRLNTLASTAPREGQSDLAAAIDLIMNTRETDNGRDE